MKKFLFATLISLTLFSCSKSGSKCYYCTFAPVSGSAQEPPRNVCIDRDESIESQAFHDSYGNDLQAYCTKR